MASGVAAHEDCMVAFNELKLKKQFRYIVFKLSDNNKEIVVEKRGDSTDYEDFVGDLPENACRFAVYDVPYEMEGGSRNKLVFYTWAPEGAPIKGKMVAASSKDALRRQLVGISTEVQGSDISEVDYDTVVEKLKRVAK